MPTLTIDVHGLDCPSEVKIIRNALDPFLDEEHVQFDLMNAHVVINHPEAENASERYVDAINRAGLKATVCKGHDTDEQESMSFQDRVPEIVFFASGISLFSAFILHVAFNGVMPAEVLGFFAAEQYALPVSALLVLSTLLGVSLVLPKAWSALRNFRADMHLLLCIAVAGALALGEFTESAMVAFLFAVSLRLEHWSAAKARNSIQSLLELTPLEARLVEDNVVRTVGAATVAVGDIVRILPGDRVPLDGVVVSGETALDESPVTGESMPVTKSVEDNLYAGSINQSSSVDMRVIRPANDSTVARIIRMVQEAQGRKANVERWADRFAQYYTPIMIGLAVVIAMLPPLVSQITWSDSVYRALVLLLIACPCALVISTPVTIVAGLTAAARNGVLIKGGVYLEIAATLRAVVLDKTGTITEGRPEVSQVVPMEGYSAAEMLTIAAAMEVHSTHPLAKAIVRRAGERVLDIPCAISATSIPGKGTTASIDGKAYWLGNQRLLADQGLADQILDIPEASQQTMVILGCDHHVMGLFLFRDQLRAGSLAAVEALQSIGSMRVEMLTGDNAATAQAIADATGIAHWRAELLPDDKVNAVEKIEREFGATAMVGDGINDAPAMANATLGIAMGAAGTDTALETADITLMNDQLDKVAWLILHSKRTLGIVKQNVALALGLKLIVLLLASIGFASLWLAVIADMGASLLVTFNGLRLLRHG